MAKDTTIAAHATTDMYTSAHKETVQAALKVYEATITRRINTENNGQIKEILRKDIQLINECKGMFQ